MRRAAASQQVSESASQPHRDLRVPALSPAAAETRKDGATGVSRFPALAAKTKAWRGWGTRLGVLLLAAAGMARAQMNPALTGPYRIAGTVVNAVTGERVRGATVALLTVEDDRTFASTETDSDGHFALERLPAAKFELSASKRGFVMSLYDQHEDFNSAIVTGADQNHGDFDTGHLLFKLAPDAVLSGVVTGDGGDPVEGAQVMLFRKPAGDGPEATVEGVGQEMTDDAGAYEFSELEAGTYLLAVRAEPWYAMRFPGGEAQETEQQAALDVAYPVTYFDSTTDEASATPIELASGSRQEVNFNLHAVPALSLDVNLPRTLESRFRPIDMRQIIFGEPVEGAGYVQDPGGPGGVEIAGMAPGEYQFQQGDPPRMVDVNLSASQQLDPDAGVATVEVKGLAEDAQGNPLKDAQAALSPERGTPGTNQTAPIQLGEFHFEAVPSGEWRLRITRTPGGAPLPAMWVTAGGKTAAGDGMTVGDQPLSVVAMVGAHPARIEGFARKDGKGVAGVMVVLVPRDSSAMASLARRDQSDSDGSFALLNVAPGAYTLVAIADAWGAGSEGAGSELDWADPQVIGRYLPGGVSVTVKDEADSGSGAQAPRQIRLAGPVPVQAR